MKNFFKNYKSSLILLSSMILGFILGFIFKDKMLIFKPLGDLFINMLCTIIVPLIFVTITLSIAKLQPKNVAKLLKNIIITFVFMSLVAVFVGIISTKAYRFVSNKTNISISDITADNSDANYLEKTVSMISVNDFNKLLTKDNMIALIVCAIILGVAISITKEDKKTFLNFFENTENILMNTLKIIMYYAPVGICVFCACMVPSLGKDIALDYLKVFVYYTIISLLFAFVFYSIIAKICGKSVKNFWLEAMPVIIGSISTCSSAATLPINMKVVDKMGVSKENSKTTLSLGTSFHKDGSVIDSVFKIMFLVYLFNYNISLLSIILTALIATLLVTAVPVGGGTISEMLIITLLGFPIGALPILTVIATITDAPATMLNSLGDTSACLLVDHLMKK